MQQSRRRGRESDARFMGMHNCSELIKVASGGAFAAGGPGQTGGR
jgi:hypothetical protein